MIEHFQYLGVTYEVRWAKRGRRDAICSVTPHGVPFDADAVRAATAHVLSRGRP